ncbi:putative von Willebrand factor type A [Frankia canadensis]|uniref:Putative von Willebrand factor type A n=1 Tax=Frankia canadensis TaxID=1836972 RepID=A0A2I2KZU9_9ACTN|nr:vWA domain-containing protein [Frankia canadensis]SNQ51191.1 putative von Willebrand factor type A [Frankia canadensis]SOU58481.1 putative von Willebrand factor type A [Frankia canadensis]
MPDRTVVLGEWIPRALSVAATVLAVVAATIAPALAAVTPDHAPASVTPAALSTAGSGPATVGADGRPKVHAVVLVDESNSESVESVRHEADAAGLIANSGQLDPSSEIAVVGFGTDDYPEVSQRPHGATDEACPMARVASADFRTCLSTLHNRTREEGNGTDHEAALTKALDILEANRDPAFFNVVFLLTDGGLRVDNVSRFGARLADPQATADQRNVAARQVIATQVAPRARTLGAQIWPVGFGSGLDENWMRQLATFGAGVNPLCQGVPVAAPVYHRANTASDVGQTLDQVLANASCQGYQQRQDDGGPGKPVTLSLTIPPTASSATINALKRDPNIKITYTDPRGNRVLGSGEQNGSRFTLNTSAPDSESLFISRPYPGDWKVTFTWPPGTQPRTVLADLTWLGQLSSVVRLVPSSPKPGQAANVYVSLQTSRGEPIDPKQLTGLNFQAFLAGEGFPDRQVLLADDGRVADQKAADGTFSGRVQVPENASGLLRLTGSVQGEGLRGTLQSASYPIAGRRSGGAVLQVPAVGGVHRPATITATLRADNPGSSPRQLRVRLEGLPGLSVSPADLTVPAGASGFTQALTISVAADAAYGARSGLARVLDVSAGGQDVTLDDEQLNLTVKAPPGFVAKYLYLLVLVLVLVLLGIAAALVLRARWRRRVDVCDLQANAARGDLPPIDVAAPRRWADRFRFVLHDQPGLPLSLALANPGDTANVYTVRRARHGQLTVVGPGGESRTDQAGTRIPLPSGATLWLQDRRVQPAGPAPLASDDPWAGGGGQGPDSGHDPFGAGSADPFGAPTGGQDPFAAPAGGPDPFAVPAGGQDPFGGGNAGGGGHAGADPFAGAGAAGGHGARGNGGRQPAPDPFAASAGGDPADGAGGFGGDGSGGGYGAGGYGAGGYDGGADGYGSVSDAPTLRPGAQAQPGGTWGDDWNTTQF